MKKTFIAAAFISGIVITLICSAADEVDPGNQGVITGLRNQVTRLEKEVAVLKPYAERARKLPVKFDTRKAITDNTIVLKIAESAAKLPVKITFSNATFGAKSYDRILEPCSPWTEIGTKEGWKGQSGDDVYISSEGYATTLVTLP